MQTLVFENGNGVTVDLTSGNFCVVDWSGLSETSLNIQTQQVPFNDGSVFLDALYEDREITIKLAVNDNGDLATRYELKRQLIALMNAKAGEGVLTYTNDYISKQIKAIPQLPIFENKNLNDSGTLKCTLVWNCCGVYWEDTEVNAVILSKGTCTIENKGDIETPVEINISGDTATNISINNNTTGKKLELSELTGNVKVTTETGNKKITGQAWNINKVLMYDVLDAVYDTTLQKYFLIYNTKIASGTIEDGFEVVDTSFDYLRSICYSEPLDLLVACGTNSIYTSTDGTTWTELNYHGRKVIWCDDLSAFFMLWGSSVYTSTDGTTWTSTSTGLSGTLYAICYGEGVLYVAGSDGIYATSPDGTSWTIGSSFGETIYDMFYSDNLIAVGANGYIYYNSERTSGVTTDLRGVIYFGEDLLFYAVGLSGVILTSFDGENWEIQEEGIESDLYSIIEVVDLGLITITGSGGTFYLGNKNGFENYGFKGGYEFTGVKYNEQLQEFIFYGYGVISVSSDLETFTTIYSSSDSGYINDVDYGNNLYVAGCTKGLLSSTDGETWTLTDYDAVQSVLYVDDFKKFYISILGGGIYYTRNGVDVVELVTTSGIFVFSYAEDKSILVGASNYHSILYSTDGETFTYAQFSAGTSLPYFETICYSKDVGLFLATGHDNYIITSKDGIYWEYQTLLSDSNCNSSVYASDFGMFVVGGYGLNISPDGKVWETITDIGKSVAYGGGVLVTIDDNYFVTVENTEGENIISQLSTDSDLSFGLDVGENKILLSGSGSLSAVIRYRQKYLGV